MKNIKTLAFSIFGGLLALTVVTFGSPIFAEASAATAAPLAIQSPADEITDREALDMQFMVEEEKLARDVYITLYEQWGLSIFQNISESEQKHMDAIRTLLTTYGVEDPAVGAVGEFTDPKLQTLYNNLVAQGSQSLAEALKVGGAIEEIDILDLEERIEETDKADIELVYENLLKGSFNHLRSFVSTLEQQTGEIYEPQYMEDLDAYNAIINADTETGGNGQGGSNNGGGNNNGGGGRGK